MRLQWSEPAVEDLEAIRDYIARDSQQYAFRFVERVLNLADTLTESPYRGRQVPEAAREDIREMIFGRYRLMYRIQPTRVLVLALIHGARDLERGETRPWEA